MGVDLQTYRSRIGSFHSNRGKSPIQCPCMDDGNSSFVDDGCSFTVDVGNSFAVAINDVLIFLVGATAIIMMLLLMAGVESNPGPTGEYTFRYQFLLVEIGTKVLRKVFDVRVAPDLKTYLSNNQKANTDLKTLSNPKLKILTPDQIKLLPPINKNSISDDFDITLLSCLLRNVCGLRGHNDPVWKNPVATDFSLEAGITRLRQCRNNLQHFGTVFISDADLKQKWNDLSQILNRLNVVSQIPNLQQDIINAETLALDPVLSKRYTEVIRAWHEMDTLYDRGIEELKLIIVGGHFNLSSEQSEIKQALLDGQSQLKDDILKMMARDKQDILDSHLQVKQTLIDGQSNIQKNILANQSQNTQDILDGQSKLEQNQSVCFNEMRDDLQQTKQKVDDIHQTLLEPKKTDMKSGIKEKLIDFYKKRCRTLPVSPLCNKDIDELELLSIYKPPSLHHVDYHKPREFGQSYTEQHDAKSNISGYKNIFYKNDKRFRKVFITGDAGVGKTSFCKRVAILWTMSQCGESSSDRGIQNDIDFLSKFEFVFYISLSGTCGIDIVNIIVEQLLRAKDPVKRNQLYECVEQILRETECIIIMDALDERKSTESVTVDTDLSLYDKCTFLNTCRPYKIENERLSRSEIDRQIQMTGIDQQSINRYITEIVNRMNENKREKKNPEYFVKDIVKCRLKEQLRVPIICSHLVAVWFKRTLTEMSRALIYSHIVDMLLKRAEKEEQIELPSSQTCDLQLPDCLSELCFLKKHIPFLNKLCLLSFNVLFKQDKCLSELVFTPEQLDSEPYCLSAKEMEFLCKFGILSKSKVISEDEEQGQKLSFLHKTYIEYFSALFVSTFDLSNAFVEVVNTWNSIKDVVQFETFFIFLVGFSYPKSNDLIEKVYHLISRDLNECRRNALFDLWDPDAYMKQLKFIQTMIINCFKEIRGSHSPQSSFKLENFIFDDNNDDADDNDDDDDNDDGEFTFDDENTEDICKKLLSLNYSFVKSISSSKGEYLSNFDHINSLQYLHVGNVTSDYPKFIECMELNHSSLHTLSIEGNNTLIQLPPVTCVSTLRSLFYYITRQHTRYIHNLTSLSLCKVKLEHKSFKYLVKYLSDNVNMQNIKLVMVHCDEHWYDDITCTMTLDLRQHKQLHSLCLTYVNIICNKVNTSRLKSLALRPVSDTIVSSYVNVFHCINNSQLEYLDISGSNSYRLDYNTVRILTSTLSTLHYIKVLTLGYMRLPDDVTIQLHHDVSQVKIGLNCVKMSHKWFESFCDSLVNYKSVVEVGLYKCNITSDVGFSYTVMSESKSMDLVSNCLTSESSLNNLYKDDEWLVFETKKSQ